jgi:phenylacetate-coenzyme A ligase PaaK-like adenylate-forming protein
MSIINLLSENLVLPISDIATGYSISKNLNFLLKSQWWNEKKIKDYQEIKLRKLIKHSVDTVPYYHDLFKNLKLKPEDIQSYDDLKKLPILTKTGIKKEGLERFISNKIPKNKIIKISSSGSTGEPLQFLVTNNSESFLKSAAIRGWYWMGYRLGDKYVKISMNPRESRIKKAQDFVNNCLYLSSTQLTEVEFLKIIRQIEKYNPKIIRGYPVPLFFLAEMIEKRGGIRCSNLLAINTTGSTLHENMRDKIQNVFNVKIFDSYSCEGGTIFFQCEELNHYHPAEEYAISEFIEDEFTKNDPDKARRHITTDLCNYAFPFIRYDTEDYIMLGNEVNCKCGRNFLNISRIKGRDSDILVTPSGKYLIVENFVAYFEWVPSIEQFQIYQKRLNLIKMRFIVNNLFNEKIKKELYDYWQNYIGDDVEIIFEIVDEIKLTPTGKRKNVIRNADIKLN